MLAAKALRLALAIQWPIHYHLPLYRAITADPDIDGDILFMQRSSSESGYDPELDGKVDWGVALLDGYPYRLFRNVSPLRNGEGFWKFINPGLVWRILTGPYDAVYIHGHNHFTHVLCMIAARLGGKRLILRNIAYNLGKRPAFKRLVRLLIYRMLYLLPQAFLYIGTYNRQYFAAFGVADDRLVYGPHIVDNAFFADQATRLEGRRAASGPTQPWFTLRGAGRRS